VESGSRTLKDAINEAMRDWVTNVRGTHYLWAACWARIRIRRWCAISFGDRARSTRADTGKLKASCLRRSLPAWAVDPTRLESSINFYRTKSEADRRGGRWARQ